MCGRNPPDNGDMLFVAVSGSVGEPTPRNEEGSSPYPERSWRFEPVREAILEYKL